MRNRRPGDGVVRLWRNDTLLESEKRTVDDRGKAPEAVRYVRAERLSTRDASKGPSEERVCVVEETAVTIDVDGVETYTVLCNPTDKLAMAVGFLFAAAF